MSSGIIRVTLLIIDYQEAIDFYTNKLGFKLIEDTQISEAKRWVIVAPNNSRGCQILLAKAANDHQKSIVGNQAGGRVFLFLYTENFWEDHQRMTSVGVKFKESPREEPYGTVAVFEDLYGNLWDLLEPNDSY